MTGALLTIAPGGMRELHWHPERSGVAVLSEGQCAHDRVRLRRPRANR